MKNCVAILIVALATAGISADEIKSDQPVSVTGKLGFYTDKEDGFTITITADHVVVPANAGNWHNAVPKSIPVKRVALDLSDNDPRLKELTKRASEGKIVTLHGSFRLWERHIKLGRRDVLIFRFNSVAKKGAGASCRDLRSRATVDRPDFVGPCAWLRPFTRASCAAVEDNPAPWNFEALTDARGWILP